MLEIWRKAHLSLSLSKIITFGHKSRISTLSSARSTKPLLS